MHDTDLDRALAALVEARKMHSPVAAPPADVFLSLEQGYMVQDRHVSALTGWLGSTTVGYKIGCTNRTAQALLGISEPFAGCLLDATCHASPARLPTSSFFFRCIEAEYAFRMAEDLPHVSVPYEREQVAASVGAVLPSIEVVDSRYTNWTTAGAAANIADNGSHGHWVHGVPVESWRTHDLADIDVELFVDQERVRVGTAANVLGHPLNALTWLANHLASRGKTLRAGDFVSTGTCIDVYMAEPGDHVSAQFGSLGNVDITFVPE